MGTYDHLPTAQAANMRLGARLRAARCLLGNAKSTNSGGFEIFTQDELDLIQEIASNAEERAKETHTKEITEYYAKQPQTRSGAQGK